MYIKTQVPGMIEQTKMTIENDDFNIPVVVDREVRQMQVEIERNAIPARIKSEDPVKYKVYNNEKEVPCNWDGLVAIATSPTAKVVQHDDYIEFIVTDKFGTTTAILYAGGGTGIVDYEKLLNLPKINDVTVKGNKTLEEYDIQESMDSITLAEISFITGD